jgi:hypothetical protein
MKRIPKIIALTFALVFTVSTALANPEPPTNGGSANGGGSSGQCTGANDDRPASCHNGQGDGN